MARPFAQLTHRQRLAWRSAQIALFLVALVIILALVLAPRVGLTALWKVLVPIAPALLVVAPGLWRNICPLGSTALWARHVGLSARRRLSPESQGWFMLIAVALLLAIVPLRHILLNTNGPVTGAVLVLVGLASIIVGMTYEWKSGWCSGLCPVFPVEALYGQRPALTLPNAHCTECSRCSTVCADTTPAMSPLITPRTTGYAIAGALMIGGFPGYVWGWFQVSDAAQLDASAVANAYAWPLGGCVVTLASYLVIRAAVGRRAGDLLARVHAAAAVATYYWFVLPTLLGFGRAPGEGALIDLHDIAPQWTPMALRAATIAFFGWWMVVRPSSARRAWAYRPRYAAGYEPGTQVTGYVPLSTSVGS